LKGQIFVGHTEDVTGSDGERYLRLVAEQMLRERPDGSVLPVDARLVAAGAALVAVGALPAGTARSIVDAYSRARQPRGAAASPPRDPEPSGAAEFGPWRAVPSGHVIVRPWGRLDIGHVLLTGEATVLKVALVSASPGASSARCAPWDLGLPRTLEIGDDRGTTSVAHFEGGRRHGEQAWHGTFAARPALAPGAAWISVLGERVDLTAEPPAIRSWAEPVETGDPARHHLWERVATRNDFHDPRAALEAAIAALAAVGTLAADDPVTGDTRLAAALMYPGPKDSVVAAATPSMPAPWRSLVARWGRTDGPVGSVPVGKVSAPFDGVRVAVAAIDSRAEFFSVGVEVVPGLRTGLPYGALDDLRHITWWAVDDRGNYSLAEQGSWSPGASRARGSLGFWPGLDPGATWIDLMPTTASARAVIRVPLPWAAPG
jgi:hypothetical protein